MIKAVAKRPIEQFDTQVTLPEWQLEPDEESYFGAPDNGFFFFDENGYPVGPVGAYPGDYPSDGYPPEQGYPDAYPGGVYPPQGSEYPPERVPGDTGTTRTEDLRRGNLRYPPAQQPTAPPPEQLDQDWMDRVLGRTPEREQRAAPVPGRTPVPSRAPADRQRGPQEARPIQ
jgi:penicillin-binding protein 1A